MTIAARAVGERVAAEVAAHHQHADTASQENVHNRLQALSYGLVGSALAVPLAIAAALDASPILSFYR